VVIFSLEFSIYVLFKFVSITGTSLSNLILMVILL